MIYVLGEPLSWLQEQLTDWLEGLQGSNAVVLGLILGAMMASDMGGPLNKVAYTFAVGLIDSGVTAPMAAVMAAGMTPPLALALGTVLFPGRWTKDGHEAGKPAWVLGPSFIPRGRSRSPPGTPCGSSPRSSPGRPPRVPSRSAWTPPPRCPTAASSTCPCRAPSTTPGWWLVAIVAGMLVTTAVLVFTKRPVAAAVPIDRLEAAAAPA